MRRSSVWAILGVLLLWTGAVDADDFNQLLHGDYAFTGEATCLVALGGFSSTLTPLPGGRFVVSFSVQGVRTFNGDGTGTLSGRSVSITHSDNPVQGGSAAANDFVASFTYSVAPDRTFTSAVTGPLTGTFVAGPRTGQTFSIDPFPLVAGMIAQDNKNLTLAHPEPTVETQTFSNGDVHPRICHRSRILLRLKSDN
jgi:hypothetical protein